MKIVGLFEMCQFHTIWYEIVDCFFTDMDAPVSIGDARSRSLGCRQDREPGVRPPGTGPHVPVGHNQGSDAINSDRSPWRID